jgi:hypothetical protein
MERRTPRQIEPEVGGLAGALSAGWSLASLFVLARSFFLGAQRARMPSEIAVSNCCATYRGRVTKLMA